LAGRPPELLWKGPSEGLAISPDGLLLAFWRVEKGADTLVLYDLKKKSEARTWRLPDRFESDKSGWDLASHMTDTLCTHALMTNSAVPRSSDSILPAAK